MFSVSYSAANDSLIISLVFLFLTCSDLMCWKFVFCETSSGTSIDESELARKIVYHWDEGMYLHPIMINMQITGGLFNYPYNYWFAASSDVRQAYKQFIGAVVEVVDGELSSEEFRAVALAVYLLFHEQIEEEDADQRVTEKK